jgi:phage-related protein
VIHAFEKKSQRTAKADIELGQQRWRDVLAERRECAARAKREK